MIAATLSLSVLTFPCLPHEVPPAQVSSDDLANLTRPPCMRGPYQEQHCVPDAIISFTLGASVFC